MTCERWVTVASAMVLAACATVATEDLGHGFRIESKRERSSSTFERYAYSNYLKFKGRVLGDVGFYDVSPSGRFAVYEVEGRLLLFQAASGKVVDVTGERFSLPARVTWNEQAGSATFIFSEPIPPREIQLNPEPEASLTSSHDAT